MCNAQLQFKYKLLSEKKKKEKQEAIISVTITKCNQKLLERGNKIKLMLMLNIIVIIIIKINNKKKNNLLMMSEHEPKKSVWYNEAVREIILAMECVRHEIRLLSASSINTFVGTSMKMMDKKTINFVQVQLRHTVQCN